MEEIKAGEYIRTKNGIIDRVIIDYYGICNSPNCNCKHVSCQYDYYDEEDIVKYSSNIIDLIEVGDFVNDYKILKITELNENAKIFAIFKYETEYSYGWHNEDIKTILTKEQYEQNCYRLEKENE